MPILLSESDVRALITMGDLIALMKEALTLLSTGGVVQPLRIGFNVPKYRGGLSLMPAYIGEKEALGFKSVTFFHGNNARGLPSDLATIILLNSETGALLAVMDGRLITEMRTAAVSAAATKHLATRATGVVVGLLGSGVQARSHVLALLEVCQIDTLQVWNRTKANAVRFARDVTERFGLRVALKASPEEAVRGADIICTTTASQEPVLYGKWLDPGVHINAVGDSRELDSEAVVRSHVFVDSREAALVEADEIIQAIKQGQIHESHVLAEIGEVFGGIHPGRTATDQITLFRSLGQAVEDMAAAQFVYKEAQKRGVGEEFSLQ